MILKATPIAAPESVTDAGAFLVRLEDLQGDGDYSWALDTIEGIYETVTEQGRVTTGQLRAINNIVASVKDRSQWRR